MKASKFKWATSLDNQFKFDFKTATPKEDIAQIDWVGCQILDPECTIH